MDPVATSMEPFLCAPLMCVGGVKSPRPAMHMHPPSCNNNILDMQEP